MYHEDLKNRPGSDVHEGTGGPGGAAPPTRPEALKGGSGGGGAPRIESEKVPWVKDFIKKN